MNRRAALWLGLANAGDYVVQLLLPALLVRTLSPEEFGGYRILWLVAQTSATALSLNMALNLLYLAPKHPLARRGRLLGNVFAYLALAGLLAALLAMSISGELGLQAGGRPLPVWMVGLFTALWMVSLPFDQLALVAGRPRTHAQLAGGQTLLRALLLGLCAAISHDLAAVALAMIALAALRLGAALYFARASGAFPGFGLDAPMARDQLVYGLGFGLGASLFLLRSQVDAWIAAALLDPKAVATISIAMVIGPIVSAVRQAFTQATVSDVARHVAQGDLDKALALNHEANLSTALAVFPLIGLFVVVAPDAIAWVYTPSFADAATPARLYALAFAACALELSPIVQALGHAKFVMRSGAFLLVLGSTASFVGASLWGVPGIAAGGTLALWVGTALNLGHVARHGQRSWASLQPWRAIALPFVLATVGTSIGLLFQAWLPIDNAPARCFIGAALFVGMYAALVLTQPSARALYQQQWARPKPVAPTSHG